MTATNQEQQLKELIERESVLYGVLNNLLRDEQSALIKQHAHTLETLAGQKLATMENIDLCDRNRSELLHEIGCHDRDQFLSWLSDKSELLQAWLQLESLCLQAQTTNKLNGQLIAKHLSQTTDALNVLMHSPQSTVAYARNGAAHSVIAGGRRLGEA